MQDNVPPSVLIPESELDALRRVLKQLRPLYSYQQIIDAAARSRGKEWEYARSALAKFVEKGSELEPKNFRPLAATWLYSVLGRALRYPHFDPENAPPYERLVQELLFGYREKRPNWKVDGTYFGYHGSTIHEAHFVARVLKIETEDDFVIGVRDMVPNYASMQEGTVQAYGVMTFVDFKPQIVLHARENKVGFSLISFTEPNVKKKTNEVMSLLGELHLLTDKGKIASRRYLLVRCPPDSTDTKEMFEKVGIYTNAKIPRVHRAGFDRLAEFAPETVPFPDPILAYVRDPGEPGRTR